MHSSVINIINLEKSSGDKSKMETRERTESNVSDLDLSDTKHCLLCLNDLDYVAIGQCNHKHV